MNLIELRQNLIFNFFDEKLKRYEIKDSIFLVYLLQKKIIIFKILFKSVSFLGSWFLFSVFFLVESDWGIFAFDFLAAGLIIETFLSAVFSTVSGFSTEDSTTAAQHQPFFKSQIRKSRISNV